MGIPSYFSKIVRDNPQILQAFPSTNIDALYMDFNCAIYGCVADLRKANIRVTETILIDRVLRYIDYIYNEVKPAQFMGIYIDGIPVYSKIMQQRNRRYMTVWRENRGEEIIDDFTTICISPGTEFMINLELKIIDYLAGYNIKTEFSGSNERGEGEYKIFTRINGEYKNVIVYGLDADLIMLSLYQYKIADTNIYLLREKSYMPEYSHLFKTAMIYLSISHLARDIVNILHIDIIEYIALCFIIGNDFIPHFPHLSIRNGAIESLIIIRKNIGAELINNVGGKYTWNINTLRELIKRLADNEDESLRNTIAKYNKYRAQDDTLDNYPAIHKLEDKICVGSNGWIRRWYVLLLRGDNDNLEADINNIATNYIESLQFTLDYYMNKSVNHKLCWHYRYPYPPLLKDIYNVLLGIKKMPDTLSGQVADIDIITHQIIIIPPKYAQLITNANLKNRVLSGDLKYYFPRDFRISAYLRVKLHECTPIIPIIDVNKLIGRIIAAKNANSLT
jgi:5'-3' exoribonuclease 1